jgi:predicted dienelactone hydrolase
MKHLFLGWFLSVTLLLATSPQAFAVEMAMTEIGGIEVAYWVPLGASEKTPVIIFSPAFTSCVKSSQFITRAISNADYAVFVPTHMDSRCNNKRPGGSVIPAAPFMNPELWSDQSYIDRRNDIKTLLDLLPADKRFKSLGWDKVGIAGYSLGGYAALGMAGAWPSWKDARIKAVLALSPYGKPFLHHKTIGNVNVPVMYQGGTSDWLGDDMKKKDGLYALTNAPKSFLEFKGASHNDWNNSGINDYKYSISTYSIAFFDYYLKGKPLAVELQTPNRFMSLLWIDKMAPEQPAAAAASK